MRGELKRQQGRNNITLIPSYSFVHLYIGNIHGGKKTT